MSLLQRLFILAAIGFTLVLLPEFFAFPFDRRWFYYVALAIVIYAVWLIVRSSRAS